MQENDFDRFAAMLTGVADYYGRQLSAGAVTVYWQGLKDFDLQAVEAAMWQHAKAGDNGQFMPKIADVAKLIEGGRGDKAQLAWTKVDRAIRMVGTYADVIFDDKLIHATIADMGGWIHIGTKSDDDWPFVQREFETRYRGHAQRIGDVPHQSVLTGIANAQNGPTGQTLQPARLIGDPEKAKEVYRLGTNKPLLGFVAVDVAQIASDKWSNVKRLK